MAKADSAQKARTVTGIEYGKRVVRVATVTVGRSGKVSFRGLSQALVQPGRPGVAEDARLGRRAALKEALSKHPKDLGDVIVGIPRENVISRMLSVPSGDPSEVREMLFFEVDKYLPFPPDEGEISYRILEQIGANESHVLMVAARRKDLYETLDELDEAGIEPLRLDVEAHGCGYVFARNGEASEDPFAVVHLDLQSTLVGLIKDRQLRFSRATPISTEELESTSPGVSFGGEPQDWPEPQSQWWTGAMRNLKRTLAGFAHDTHGSHPKQILLSGPGSQIPGLREALEREIALPVATRLPLPPGKNNEPLLLYSSAIGLALEEVEGRQHINLVPEEIYQRRETARRKQFLVNSSILLAFNLFLAAAVIGHSFWHKQQVLQVFSEKILELRPAVKDIDEIAAKLDVIGKNIDTSNSAFKVVKDLFTRTPERIKISQLTFTKSDSVVMNLETYTGGDLDSYVSILADSPYFAGTIERGRVETVDLTRQQDRYPGVPRYQKINSVKAMLKSSQKLKE
jgi:Tfp pilus assembly PilM family ATPase